MTYRVPRLKLSPKLYYIVMEKKVFRVKLTLFRGGDFMVITDLGLGGRASEISR